MNGGRSRPNRPSEGTSGKPELRDAWERFAAGDDAVRGVRPAILLSWYRCRDVHRVSPLLTSAPPDGGVAEHCLHDDRLFAELGGAAGAAAAGRADMADTLITVTDGRGRILASWGHRGALRQGAASSLAPSFGWSEPSSGTNGMGTALERPGIAVVEGPEHWCQGFHGWNGAGIAVRDPVTQAPLAAVNVSRWRTQLPDWAAQWIRRTAASLEAELGDRAREIGRTLVDAFAAVDGRSTGPVLALDVAGKVVAANAAARTALGVVCAAPAVEPNARLTAEVPDLPALVARAVGRARAVEGWQGVAQLTRAGAAVDAVPVELRPVRLAGDVVGVVVAGCARPAGEALDAPADPRPFPARIAGVRGSRVVLLRPQEIRYAEADSHAVVLVTDQGRLRAAVRGIDNLERALDPAVFLRVHRRYLVNLGRVQELEHGFKGALVLSTSSREHEAIPVSRGHAPRLLQALGLA
jgi:DNA-binding LytR/AlgR family response regulator